MRRIKEAVGFRDTVALIGLLAFTAGIAARFGFAWAGIVVGGCLYLTAVVLWRDRGMSDGNTGEG